MILALLIGGCVMVTVQQGERNVVDREIDVNKNNRDREKERSP
jgi:hypothetical protein